MTATATTSVDLAALKRRHLLADVVESAGVLLRGRGRVRQGVCPFHEEREGSFTVYGDTEKWYCFGCGEGGDVLDFLQRLEGLSLPEAIRRLDSAPPSAVPRRPSRPHRTATTFQRDPALLTAAARFYAGELRRSGEARAYLASRGLDKKAAVRLGLGYSPGHGLWRFLASGGFAEERLKASGLFAGRSERFAGMVVIPEVSAGRVPWLGGRAIDHERSPRFQGLPGPKPVLGLGRLGASPPWAVVTEGIFDWLVLAQWGLPACAALGTQGLERIAHALRGCPRIFIAFDSDEPGREAASRLAGLLGSRAATLTLPGGVSDVAELAATSHGRAVFEHLLLQAARDAA